MEENNRKSRFYRVYANLPINLREEVVSVLPQRGPMTWNVAYLEVENDTELGKEILKKLNDLKII